MYYVNKDLVSLNRIFDQNLREGYLRLDLNENPGGLPEEFIRKVLDQVTPQFVSQYPETLPFTQTLAQKLGCKIENICLVNGSAEGVRHVIEAYSGPGGKILGVTPTYAMYAVYSKMYGRQFVPIEYEEDITMPVNKILDAMTEDIQILVVCNPNNPVGNVYSIEEMTQIAEKAKELEITILIDEAYHYFYPVTFIDFALKYDNVFLTRTFSKLFSLAGARLGYVVGKPKGIELVQKLCTPHNVNAFAMKFAEEVFNTEGMLESLIEKQLEGKKYVVDTLREKGYAVNAKEGNFIFIKTKLDAEEIMHRLKRDKGILVKTYDGIGELGKCLRVTTGEKDIMRSFVDALVDADR